jgi:hypothetical protein
MPWDANIMGAMTSTRLLQAGKKKLGAENKLKGGCMPWYTQQA